MTAFFPATSTIHVLFREGRSLALRLGNVPRKAYERDTDLLTASDPGSVSAIVGGRIGTPGGPELTEDRAHGMCPLGSGRSE